MQTKQAKLDILGVLPELGECGASSEESTNALE
jgi:hypothetical protein